MPIEQEQYQQNQIEPYLGLQQSKRVALVRIHLASKKWHFFRSKFFLVGESIEDGCDVWQLS